MQRILYNRRFWISLIILFIATLSIFLYKNFNTLLTNWFDTLKILLGIIGLVTTLFNHWKKFNLFITRIWIVLSNSSAIWNVSSNFEGDFDKKVFNKTIDEIRKKSNVMDYYEVSDTVTRLSINGLNYSFEYTDIETDDGDIKGKLSCRVIDFNSSYDYSIRIFEEDIIPHFRIIETLCRPNDKTFNFKISFKGKNPFIRLITKNVNTNFVNSLWYSVQEETKVGRRDIKVSQKSIECTTSDITDFQHSSVNFISLVGG